MNREIERKFLVSESRFLHGHAGEFIVQGYVAKEAGGMTTRVRICANRAYLTLKGPRQGIGRDEFEYPIPVDDAWHLLLDHCGHRIIEKTRHRIAYADHLFEVDVFSGRNSGLIIAEVELAYEAQSLMLPPWIGEEVTLDKRFGNFSLALFEGPPLPEERYGLENHMSPRRLQLVHGAHRAAATS